VKRCSKAVKAVSHLILHRNHSNAQLAAEGNAAVKGAHENELQDEEGLQSRSVVCKSHAFVAVSHDGFSAKTASFSIGAVTSDGSHDGTGEDGDARAKGADKRA